MEYILHKIYVDKSIKPFCKKTIFKKLSVKLWKECVFFCEFPFNKANLWIYLNLFPVSVVFSDIFMCKMEEDVVVPAQPIFYKCYVYDTYIRTKKKC